MSKNYDRFMVILPSLSERQRTPILDFYDELRAENKQLREDYEACNRSHRSGPDGRAEHE